MESNHFESLYPTNTRFAEIEKVLQYVKEGKSSQVLSLPGGGRSNFLGLLTYNKKLCKKHLGENEKWLHFVLIDFSQVKNTSLLQVYKLIFLELIDSLSQRDLMKEYAHAKQIFSQALEHSDELVLFQALKKTIEFLTLEKKLTIVFLFDRFEEYLPLLSSEFFQKLRALRDRSKYRFSVVFSLHKALEDITEPELIKDFAEFFVGNNVYLQLFDKIGMDFRIAYIEKVSNKSLPQDTKKTILEQTGGHAKLTRLAVETALITNYELGIRNYREHFLSKPSIQKVCGDIWQSLSPAEQTHMLKNLFPSVLDDEHSQYLKKIGLMADERITIPLFEAFVEEKKGEQKKDSAILFTEISDKLTATEFRLLQFFLKNPNTILERNHIIENVWRENKSMAGVSDQALDQIIFRLRKKIEEDPNAPTHIQTIKGRGFRFIP